MWMLKYDDAKVKRYVELFGLHTKMKFNEKGLKTNVPSVYHGCKAYNWLKKDKVEEYMTAKPKRLLEMHEELYKLLKGKGKGINKKEIECINSIINYKHYIDQNKEMSYELAKLMNSNTCTYCNRQYTLTVVDKRKREKLLRPEFDHWFPQSKYPDLALSYYNLIPACHYCNSSLKGFDEMDLKEYIHPYIDEKIGFHFSYVPTSTGYAVTTEKNDDVDSSYYARVFNTLDMFKIQQVYDAHSDLELKDLMDLANANPKDYIGTLVNEVMAKAGVDIESAYRMLFGIELYEEKYKNRPMSKFKNDIIRKIREEMG